VSHVLSQTSKAPPPLHQVTLLAPPLLLRFRLKLLLHAEQILFCMQKDGRGGIIAPSFCMQKDGRGGIIAPSFCMQKDGNAKGWEGGNNFPFVLHAKGWEGGNNSPPPRFYFLGRAGSDSALISRPGPA